LPLPIVLALSFANPMLLWGLAAASLPILIHLLNKRKFREMEWAAMKFLLAAIQKNSRRIQIENWILLAIRTLLIILVVAAMARPFLESLGALPILAGERTHHVIVLDGSLSMAYKTGGVSRWEQAKDLASQLVKESRRGDALSVVLMAAPPRAVIKDPSPNHTEVLKELESITLPHGGTDLAATFSVIDRVLEASPISQKEVVFLTDLQAASWRNPEQEQDAALKRSLASLSSRKVRSIIIDLGKDAAPNRALVDLGVSPNLVTLGNSALVRAVVRNYGTEPAEGLRVKLIVDGRLGPEERINLAPGGDQTVAFPYQFISEGDHSLEVQIDDDALGLDNRRWQSVPVREHVNVLLVDGHFKPEPFEAETDFLSAALNPATESEGTPNLIRTTVVPESQLSRSDLSTYDTVVLCNIAQFTESEVNALEEYLKQGGGVAVFGGDQVVRENYNRLLHAEGKGILPASIGPNVGNAARRNTTSFGFAPLGYRHPIIQDYADATEAVQASLTGTRTNEYHKLVLPKGSRAKIALGFDNGDPAIVESTWGRGTVFQVATSADSGWTNWPAHPSFPPVMEKIVLESAAGRMAERNVLVGQPIDQTLPLSAGTAPVTVVTPDRRNLGARLREDGSMSQLHFEETEISGPYTIKYGPPLAKDSLFAVNPPSQESDTAKLDRAGVAAALPGWNFAYLTNWKELSNNASAVGRRGELHRPLLFGVLALILAESIIAWYFGHRASRA